jgi:hypothetical protein
MNYKWEITSIKKKDIGDLSNVIFQVYWKKIGTDDNGNSAEFSGATPLSTEYIDSKNFNPYDELSEEVVLGWIKSIVVGEYERHVNEQIQNKIDMEVNSEINSFPWSSSEEDGVTPSFYKDAEDFEEPT